MNAKLHTYVPDLNNWLSGVTAAAAIIYALAFFLRIVKSYFVRSATGLDIDLSVPDNPQSMIALLWIGAAICLCFLHEGGKILALLSFGGIIAFFIHWATMTSHIRVNMGVSTIPNAGVIGNIWIGAGIVDVVAFVAAVVILGCDLYLLWRNHVRRTRKQALSVPVA